MTPRLPVSTVTECCVIDTRKDKNFVMLEFKSKEHKEFLRSLTPTQMAIMKLVAQGKSNAHIAEKMNCTSSNIDNHIHLLIAKSGVPSGMHKRVYLVLRYLGIDE